MAVSPFNLKLPATTWTVLAEYQVSIPQAALGPNFNFASVLGGFRQFEPE
jgi:hypothetical protein